MPFQCPKCLQSYSLEIAQILQLPPDQRSDEIVLQVLACSQCGLRALGVYEESRRGSLETDTWDHFGYLVKDETVEAVAEAISQCPTPYNHRCDCDTHLRFTNQQRRRAWIGIQAIEGMEIEGTFRMHLE
jgi:ferredoxin